jgi:thiol-disulfide isomerase/thioredoxin
MTSRWNVRRAAIGIACVLAALVLVGCTSSGSTSGSKFVAGDGTVEIVPEPDRKPAPEITGEMFDGQPFALASYRGKVVALNVWASWCAPCRAEAPTLNQVSREYAAKPVQFIGLNTRDTRASAEAFVKRFEVPYPNVWDPSAQIQLAFRDTLPPAAIPSTIFVDAQGRVAARALGRVERPELRNVLDELLASTPASPQATSTS